MRTLLRTLLICVLAPAAAGWADDKPATATDKPAPDRPLTAFNKTVGLRSRSFGLLGPPGHPRAPW